MPSFDVVSRVDMQEMDNAVNLVKKEVSARFDFRGSKTSVDLDRKEGTVILQTEDDMRLRALADMLITKAVKRGLDTQAFTFGTPQRAAGDMVRQEVTVTTGIDTDTARKVVKVIKDRKLKVQAAIQGDEVRITGRKRDDLQEVIALLKAEDFGMPLQYVNMRD